MNSDPKAEVEVSNEESKSDVVETSLALFPRATPRPWRADRHDIVGGEGKNYVALVCIGGTRTGNANRNLILHAVNSYDALRAAAVAAAIPYEALLMDNESRKWIAPEVWSAIEKAVEQLRAALHPQQQETK